jgi:hypothetical protein
VVGEGAGGRESFVVREVEGRGFADCGINATMKGTGLKHEGTKMRKATKDSWKEVAGDRKILSGRCAFAG